MGQQTVLYTVAQLEALGPDFLLKPAEVAAMFRVDPKTVTRWAAAGRMPSIRTDGGHRRYKAGVILERLKQGERAPSL